MTKSCENKKFYLSSVKRGEDNFINTNRERDKKLEMI